MSDRHIVQKNFNFLLEEYCSWILPEVIMSWKELSSEEQHSMSSLNNFFCGLHLLIGMTDTAASTLLQWETTHFSEDLLTMLLVYWCASLNQELSDLCELLVKH